MLKYVRDTSSRTASLREASDYLQMLVDPFSPKGHRYPDETIVPTALIRFSASTTYTVDAAAAASGFNATLCWKLRTAFNGPGGFDSTFTYPTTNGNIPTYRDYGAPQASWAAISTIDRTLACGIRVRHIGLPVSTFVPSGTLYFLQTQVGESTGAYSTESACIQAVTAMKGFSLTCAELSRLGGAVHIPYLPQGPMSYVFSAPTNAASGFPDNVNTIADQSVAANGNLFVIGFGLQAGVILRIDYAHHAEYIPGLAAAGLVETKVEMPSVDTREKIAHGTSTVLRTIGGGTSAASLSLFPSGSSPFGGGSGSTLGSMVESLMGFAGSATGVSFLNGAMKAVSGMF